MLKKITKIFYLVFIVLFIFFIIKYYFSSKNIKITNKSRSLYSLKINNDIENLPLLKNNTNNIIEYSDDIETYKKRKKNYKFWDLLKK